MSNYEIIYNNTIKKFIINIITDYINMGELPKDIVIESMDGNIAVKWGAWTIFTVYANDLTVKELLIKMLNHIFYL